MRRMYLEDQSRVTGQLRLSLERTEEGRPSREGAGTTAQENKVQSQGSGKKEEKGRAGWDTPK